MPAEQPRPQGVGINAGGLIEDPRTPCRHLVPVYTFGEVRSLGVKPTDVLGVGNLMKRLLGIWIPLVGIWVPCR